MYRCNTAGSIQVTTGTRRRRRPASSSSCCAPPADDTPTSGSGFCTSRRTLRSILYSPRPLSCQSLSRPSLLRAPLARYRHELFDSGRRRFHFRAGDFLPTSGTGSRVGRFRTGALFAGLSTSTVVRLPRCAVTCSDYRRARGSSCRCPRQRRVCPVYRRADSRRSTLRLPVLREQLSATSRRLSHGADEQRVENDEDRARNELDEDHAEPVVDVELQADDLRTEL